MNKDYNEWKNLTSCEISNKNNPYDNVGEIHNELMAEIEKAGNPEMSLDEVYKLSDEIIISTFGNKIIPRFSSKKIATPIVSIQDDEEYSKFINSLDINKEEKWIYFGLSDIMFRYNGENLENIITEIKEFENNILKRYHPEKIINVLLSSSICRYALSYWDYRVRETGVSALRKGFWKKLFTGVADALGGLAGGAAATPTVIGIIAGAVGGAIGASAGFSKIWDIFAK